MARARVLHPHNAPKEVVAQPGEEEARPFLGRALGQGFRVVAKDHGHGAHKVVQDVDGRLIDVEARVEVGWVRK